MEILHEIESRRKVLNKIVEGIQEQIKFISNEENLNQQLSTEWYFKQNEKLLHVKNTN